MTEAVADKLSVRTTQAESATPSRLADLTQGAVRIVVGFLFACHGAANVLGVFGGHAQALGAWPGWWAGVIELVGGALVMVGLFTRPAAVINSGAMAYAYFSVHQAAALLPLQNKGEPAAMFCWVFLLFAVVGPGALALDAVLRRRKG